MLIRFWFIKCIHFDLSNVLKLQPIHFYLAIMTTWMGCSVKLIFCGWILARNIMMLWLEWPGFKQRNWRYKWRLISTDSWPQWHPQPAGSLHHHHSTSYSQNTAQYYMHILYTVGMYLSLLLVYDFAPTNCSLTWVENLSHWTKIETSTIKYCEIFDVVR